MGISQVHAPNPEHTPSSLLTTSYLLSCDGYAAVTAAVGMVVVVVLCVLLPIRVSGAYQPGAS